uniref:Uncharacterized protein n=1 Tax=Meloidogyne enterolobii TaxID=390850 RepID=A0A6V7UHN6_MELEN|nr:unnamed protein product [Meloidogyne enterolobii]
MFVVNIKGNLERLDQENCGLKLKSELHKIENVVFAKLQAHHVGIVIQNMKTIYVEHVTKNNIEQSLEQIKLKERIRTNKY